MSSQRMQILFKEMTETHIEIRKLKMGALNIIEIFNTIGIL
jgi:hypothetical protein